MLPLASHKPQWVLVFERYEFFFFALYIPYFIIILIVIRQADLWIPGHCGRIVSFRTASVIERDLVSKNIT